jgi:hypothetical protein
MQNYTTTKHLEVKMSNKQTTVMKLLQYILVDCRNKDGVIQFSAHETFNEYLEMEKQQIINAFNEGEINSVDYFNAENITIEEAEQYYNETFGK